MLLLGALFALLMAGFWLCCLADVALTPGDECPGLPKAAWIVLVAGTFVAGAAVWLAFRRPARPTVSPVRVGRDAGDGPPSAPEDRDLSVHRAVRPDPGHARNGPGMARNDPDAAGNGPGDTLSGPGGARNGTDTAAAAPGRAEGSRRGGWDGPGMCSSLEAEAALLRPPAGRSRPRGVPGQSPPMGPDDDPDFLRSLSRAIHGADPGDDPAGPMGWARRRAPALSPLGP